eukprot:IDg19271t1
MGVSSPAYTLDCQPLRCGSHHRHALSTVSLSAVRLMTDGHSRLLSSDCLLPAILSRLSALLRTAIFTTVLLRQSASLLTVSSRSLSRDCQPLSVHLLFFETRLTNLPTCVHPRRSPSLRSPPLQLYACPSSSLEDISYREGATSFCEASSTAIISVFIQVRSSSEIRRNLFPLSIDSSNTNLGFYSGPFFISDKNLPVSDK